MSAARSSQRGTTLLEVLVAMIIIAVGLLGMAGMQTRLQVAEMEAYQRAQALLLVGEMHDRIKLNFGAAGDYVTGVDSPLGVGMVCPTGTATREQVDTREWCNTLQGAAESLGGVRVGAMIGARGCVEDLGGNEYLITVAWQGLTPISSPSSDCGRDLYNGGTNPACSGDLCRRTVSTKVAIQP